MNRFFDLARCISCDLAYSRSLKSARYLWTKNLAHGYSHISIYVKANMFISLPAKRHKKNRTHFTASDTVCRKSVKSTGERCSPLHTNSVFTQIVGDGVLDVPLVSDFFNKLNRTHFTAPDKYYQFFFFAPAFTAVKLHTSPAASQKYGEEVTELMLKKACIR